MNLGLKNKMAFQGTVVSNTFIDTYMTAANGEYVKVFLYLLRHEGEEVTVSAIADALDLHDIILEIDNKSKTNRPDRWGHYGIAREPFGAGGRRRPSGAPPERGKGSGGGQGCGDPRGGKQLRPYGAPFRG